MFATTTIKSSPLRFLLADFRISKEDILQQNEEKKKIEAMNDRAEEEDENWRIRKAKKRTRAHTMINRIRQDQRAFEAGIIKKVDAANNNNKSVNKKDAIDRIRQDHKAFEGDYKKFFYGQPADPWLVQRIADIGENCDQFVRQCCRDSSWLKFDDLLAAAESMHTLHMVMDALFKARMLIKKITNKNLNKSDASPVFPKDYGKKIWSKLRNDLKKRDYGQTKAQLVQLYGELMKPVRVFIEESGQRGLYKALKQVNELRALGGMEFPDRYV